MSGNPYADELGRQLARIMTGEVAIPPERKPSLQDQQAQRLWQRQYQDQQLATERRILAARAKADEVEKARRKSLAADQQQRAEELERKMEEQAKRDFLSRNGKLEDFPKYYATRKYDLFDELTKQEQERSLRRMPAYGAI